MGEIQLLKNKTLKLVNALIFSVDLTADSMPNIDLEIEKMRIYIVTHGFRQIGPLIQFTSLNIVEDEETDIQIKFMLQADRFIHSVEAPYKMERVIRIANCLVARFKGLEEDIKYAHDKLGVYAYENGVELCGDIYTVYVDKDEKNDEISADIFMPCK